MKEDQKPKHVSIIGAGLAGLAMAIMLDCEGIDFDVYEKRDPDAAHALGGSVVLSPNALRLIDDMGFYDQVTGMIWQDTITFDDELNLKSRYLMGSKELYGYDALRAVRKTLTREMKDVLRTRGVADKIHWNSRLSRILRDDKNGVEFELENGDRLKTDLLIGADGMHSRVRRHVAPDVPPEYAGYFMCLSYIATSALRLPPEKEQYRYKPMLVQGKSGGMQLSAQKEDGSECFCLRQFLYPEQDAAGWKALNSDKRKLLDMFRQNYEHFPDIVKSAMDASTEEGMGVWPIYTIPTLKNWATQTGRVVLIGDAAHAIPPAAGQGVNQAFEDAFGLGLLLSQIRKGIQLSDALEFWQSWRQDRIERVRRLATQLSLARMSEEEREKHSDLGEATSSENGELRWLYDPKPSLREAIECWNGEQTA